MNYLKLLISNLFNTKKTGYFVGRWYVKNIGKEFNPLLRNSKIINIIVDRNNEDHCGTCHQIVNNKIKLK